jgi:hypothetical protein
MLARKRDVVSLVGIGRMDVEHLFWVMMADRTRLVTVMVLQNTSISKQKT